MCMSKGYGKSKRDAITVADKQTHQIEYLRNANFLEKTDDRIESRQSNTA